MSPQTGETNPWVSSGICGCPVTTQSPGLVVTWKTAIDDIVTFLSALAFFARPNPDTQSAFDSATRALRSLDPDSERLDELQVQVRLLLETATGSAGPE